MAVESAMDMEAIYPKRASRKRGNRDESGEEEEGAPKRRNKGDHNQKGGFSGNKIPTHFEDELEDEEEQQEQEQDQDQDHEDSTKQKKKKSQRGEEVDTSPATMRRFCKLIKELRSEKRLEDTTLSNVTVKKLTLDNEDRFNDEMRGAITDLRYFHTLATKPANVRMFAAVDVVEAFLNEEPSAVTLHPNFPTKPMHVHLCYVRKAGNKGMKATLVDAKRAIEQEPDNPLVVESRKETEEAERDYAKKLKDFLRDYKESIPSHQVPYINKLIRKEEEKKSKKTSVASKQ